MTNTKKTNIALLLLFFGDAFVSPFLALNFIRLGFSNDQLAILLAIKPICSVIGNFIYGHFSSDVKRDVLLMKIINVICIVTLFGFAFARSFELCLALMIIWSLNNSPMFSLSDGVADKFCERDHKPYSITRMFGSIGYFSCLIIGGIFGVTVGIDYTITFIVAAIVFILLLISLFFLKPFEMEKETKKKISFKPLFKDKRFIFYLFFYLFIIGVWKVSDDYTSEFFNSLGLSDGAWSFVYAGGVLFEVITILLINKFVKKNGTYVKLLIMSACALTLRTILFAFPMPSVVLAVLTGVLRGIGWGAFLATNMFIIEKMLGANLVTKAVTVLTIEVNVFSSIGNYFYLSLRKWLGIPLLYSILGGLQVLGIVFLVFIDYSFIKKEKSVTEV